MRKRKSFTHALIRVPHIFDFLIDEMPSVLPVLDSVPFDVNVFLHHIFFENLVKLVLKRSKASCDNQYPLNSKISFTLSNIFLAKGRGTFL